MITKTDFWKSIRRGFKDMKRDQEITEQVMAIIKGDKNFEPETTRGSRPQSD